MNKTLLGMKETLFRDAVLALALGVSVGVLNYFEPTDTLGVIVRLGVALAILWPFSDTVMRISVTKAVHGNMFKSNGERLAKLFSDTKLAVEYRSARQQVINGAWILFAGMASRQAPGVLVSFAVGYANLFFFFWWATRHVPPSVLILGTSSPEFGLVVDELRARLRPCRLMELLDFEKETSHFPNDRLDNFRTAANYDWKSVFKALLDAAPVVLFDGRSSTANLKYEAECIAKTKHKAVVVICTNGHSELIDSLGPEECAFYSEKSLRVDLTQTISAPEHDLIAARLTGALADVIDRALHEARGFKA